MKKIQSYFENFWCFRGPTQLTYSAYREDRLWIAAPITGSIPNSLHSLLVNNPLMYTDRWLTRPFHCILCCVYNQPEIWAEPTDPSWYTAGAHQHGSCPSQPIASHWQLRLPRCVRFSEVLTNLTRRTSSVCAVCTSLISPLRDSVQIIPLSPTKTRAEFNWVC